MTSAGTVDDQNETQNLEKLNENLKEVEALGARLTHVLANRAAPNQALEGPNQELFARAAGAFWQDALRDPAKILEHQIQYWSKSVTHFVEAQQAFAAGTMRAPQDPSPSDRRFANPLWQTHPYFNYVKRQYFINAEAIEQAVDGIEDMGPAEKKRLGYFSRQIIDLMSPTNFLATNPDALEKAVETEGQSLVDGLRNLIEDLEANDGELVVRLADESAFEIGKNIATAPGKVVYRNRMMELIQFSPSTEKVHKTPLLLFPPWINKFYILDLKEKNSLVKWIVDQGYTLFVVSWVNPDSSYAKTGFEDYIEEGYLTAIETVKKITDEPKINVIGYCIAGTALSVTLSLLKQRGDSSINSATFFTTLTDFEDPGEFAAFLENDFVDGIEAECINKGMMASHIMARTFSFLRANDLVYAPAIRSYMMGQTPPAFDLLYWNGDGTNLPGKMAMDYLRGLCQDNSFARDGFEAFGHKLKLKDVSVPVFSISCETDHIAPWRNCYQGVQQMSSRSKTFVVSQSGHIAGIVNPPSKKKYGHYTNTDLKGSPEEWFKQAQFNEGSWWPRWGAWLKKRSGAMIEARAPGGNGFDPICDAPGTYVLAKARDRK